MLLFEAASITLRARPLFWQGFALRASRAIIVISARLVYLSPTPLPLPAVPAPKLRANRGAGWLRGAGILAAASLSRRAERVLARASSAVLAVRVACRSGFFSSLPSPHRGPSKTRRYFWDQRRVPRGFDIQAMALAWIQNAVGGSSLRSCPQQRHASAVACLRCASTPRMADQSGVPASRELYCRLLAFRQVDGWFGRQRKDRCGRALDRNDQKTLKSFVINVTSL